MESSMEELQEETTHFSDELYNALEVEDDVENGELITEHKESFATPFLSKQSAGQDNEYNMVVDDVLFRAVQSNDTQLLEKLLEHTLDVNTMRDAGWTLLHCAAFYQAIDAVELLLKHAADVNISHDNFGHTALHLATQMGNVAIVQELLHSGSSIDVQTRLGHTALFIATRRKNPLLVGLLLKQGANMNIAEREGDTPLAYAKRWEYSEIVDQLLRHKTGVTADPDNSSDSTMPPSAIKGITVPQVMPVKDRKHTEASHESSHGAPRDYSTTRLDTQEKTYHPTPVDIVNVSRLLADKDIPVKVVDTILDQAEYWARITTTLDTSLRKDYTAYGSRIEHVLLLRSKPICSAAADEVSNRTSATTVPEPRSRNPVRRITWKITSNDQGWSDDKGDTYEGSWTGFRGNVLRYVPSGMSLSRDAWPSHSDPSSKVEFEPLPSQEYLSAWNDIQSPESRSEKEESGRYAEGTTDEQRVWAHGERFEKTKVQSNRRGVIEAMEHTIVWDARDCLAPDNPEANHKLDKRGRGIETGCGTQVRALCRGDVVELHSYAFFPCWKNTVKSAQLVIEFAM